RTTRGKSMRKDHIPPRMTMPAASGVEAYATLAALRWCLGRLSFALKQNGMLSDAEIVSIIDSRELTPQLPEQRRSEAEKVVARLCNHALGEADTKH
ncbi:MAG: hypothetical protein ACREHV_00670, partial [Rhizomicrobium sp.]